jgi:hypothetical protein
MPPRGGASASGALTGVSAGPIQILIFKRFFVQLSRSLSVVFELKYRHDLDRIGPNKVHEGRKHLLISPKPTGFGSNCPNHRSGPFYCCHRQTGNGAVKHKKTSKMDFDIERPERPQSAPGPRDPPQGGPWGGIPTAPPSTGIYQNDQSHFTALPPTNWLLSCTGGSF